MRTDLAAGLPILGYVVLTADPAQRHFTLTGTALEAAEVVMVVNSRPNVANDLRRIGRH